MIGQTVSHYKILSKLGEGGMGVVYKAEDLKLKRTVALKFLPPELSRDEKSKTRFIHEAQAASALQHHNICAIHEIDETPERQLFISMDCYDGETLRDKISRGPLSVAEAIDIATQVAEGLSEAHEAGIVHRDVKPGNILVTRKGVVKILDFGLAKLVGMTKVTRTGATVGTISYMSPEQARGEEVDTRSDIFSLGAVLYEMITGAVPFPGDHEAAVLYGILHGEPKPLADFDRSVPQELQKIIDKALKKDPRERCQNILDLRNDLDRAIGGEGKGGTRRRRRPRGILDPEGKARLRRRIAVGAAIVVVLGVTVSIVGPRLWRSVQVAPAHALAVMDFRDLATPEDPTVSAGMTEFMNIGLIQADLVRVVSSDLLHDLRRRHFGSPRGAIEESQTMEIARKAGATLFLTGTIRPSAVGKLVTWHLVDVQSGDDVKAGRVEGTDLGPLADRIISEAVPLIARRCGVEVAKAATAVESITTESPRAYQHFMTGLLAYEEARKEEAVAAFQRAVAEDSTFALAYLWLGRAYLVLLDDLNMEKFLQKASRLRSRLGIKDQMRLDAQILRGPMQSILLDPYGRETQVSQAIATLREMHKRWPDDRQTLVDLADMLGGRWYHAEALEVAEKGLRLYPDDAGIRGRIYPAVLVSFGRTEEALRASESYAKQHPSTPVNWSVLGRVYLAMGRPDSAEVAYRRALQLDPEWRSNRLSYCAYYRGDLKGAVADFERILSQPDLNDSRRYALTVPSHAQIHLAALYVEAGRYQKMRDVCRKYMVPSRYDMAPFRLLIEMGRAQEVLDSLEAMVRGGVRREDLYPRPLGRALVQLGDAEGARAAAVRLSGLESKRGGMACHDALEIQAWAALADHDPNTAMEFLGKLKERGLFFGGYVDIDYRTALATAYRMMGRLDEAAKVHRELLRVYGGHALSHYELATIYEEMKRPVEAKKEYEKFLEMWSEADEGLPQLVDARQRLERLQESSGL